jgi:thioredoxin reductase
MSKASTPARSAITVAQALYDEPRDLERHEQEFLSAVHRITMECARTKGEAVRAWGDGSRAFEAVAYLADSKQASHLARALTRYDAAAAAMEDAEESALDQQAAE